MDELYGDLENYNEVNAVEELRNENKELKLKLQEYETAMGKLQKDYDNLALEFQNLQNNYSSLLKTARAEVERKTQMIVQLNIEKDMTVLQSLQNGNNRKLSNNRNNLQKGFTIPKKTERVESSKNKFNKKMTNEIQAPPDLKNQRSETDSAPKHTSALKATGPRDKSMLLNIVDKVVEKVDISISKGEHKENVSLKPAKLVDSHKDSPKSCAGGISGRRKSMPVVSMPKFSSDEECEEEKATKQVVRSEIPEARNLNTIMTRLSKEKVCEKNYETTTDGRGGNNQEIANEGYRSRTGRYFESDKYRESENYRETDRLRDHDRLRDTDRMRESDRFRDTDRHREIDKHRESDKYREIEKYRGRDKYDSSHRNRKHYSPDRSHKRSNREYYDDYHRQEYGRHRVLDSPPPESHRSQHHHRSQDYRSNYERHSHDNDKYKSRYQDRHAVKHSMPSDFDEPSSKRQKIDPELPKYDNKRYHEKEVTASTSQAELQEYEMLRTSCQSPDLVLAAESHSDMTLAHTIKEIRNTAAIPLEDPRISSKKYILKSENGKPSLSTVASSNIYINPIDKSLWNLEQVAIPDALIREPESKLTDENIKEIYMDIRYPESNASIESGEICFDSEGTSPQNYKTREESVQNHGLKKLPTEKLKVDSDFVQNNTSACKVPKVQTNNQNTQNKVSNVSIDLPKIRCQEQTNDNKDSGDKEYSTKQQLLLPQIKKHDNPLSCKETEENKHENNDNFRNRITKSDMAMVQDDLELSDETSDNVDLHRQITNEKELVYTMPQMTETKDVLNRANLNPTIVPELKAGSDKTNNIDTEKVNDSDYQKKAKSKRRKTKSTDKESVVTTDECHEKKTKSKKDKESKPRQIKSKFTDLFGDSSSLITPEDLGIPASCVPLCEDAVDINIKEIVKASPSIEATEVIGKDNNAHHYESSYDTNLGGTNTEEIAKRIEEQITSPEVDVNIVYQNLNSETAANKPDVVKTIIISSGVQPQFSVGNQKQIAEKRIADVEVNIQNIVESYQPRSGVNLKKQNTLKALATSTPQKEFSVLNAIDTDSRTASYISNPNDSKSESVNTNSQQDLSDTHTQEPHDAPDVRIFVRRRRKGVKRT